MDPGGVVHAFESLYTALRPHGVLLDVRPAPEHPELEIVRGGDAVKRHRKVLRLGQLDFSFRMGALAGADAAAQALLDTGRFVRERAERFIFSYHFDSVDDWLTYMARHWPTVQISAEMVARAREELAAEAGELRILRTIQAARLRRT
jgi:hypothetical protein